MAPAEGVAWSGLVCNTVGDALIPFVVARDEMLRNVVGTGLAGTAVVVHRHGLVTCAMFEFSEFNIDLTLGTVWVGVVVVKVAGAGFEGQGGRGYTVGNIFYVNSAFGAGDLGGVGKCD